MKSKLNLLTIFIILVNTFSIDFCYSQNTFKLITNQNFGINRYLFQDYSNYKIYDLGGVSDIDTLGVLAANIKGIKKNMLQNMIFDSALYTYSFDDSLFKPYIIKSNTNIDSVRWVKTYYSNTDTLLSFNITSGIFPSILFSGTTWPNLNGSSHPPFCEIDTSGNIKHAFKEMTLNGVCKFTYRLDSITYFVGINTDLGPVLAEIDTAGNITIEKRILGNSYSFISSLQNAGGDITILGVSDINSYSNIFVINYSKGGLVNWSKEYTIESVPSFNSYEFPPSISKCHDGGYIIIATSGPVNNQPTYDDNLALVRINSIGDTLWSICHGASSTLESGSSVIETLDHGFFALGLTTSNQFYTFPNPIPYIIKTDSLGHTSTHCQESYYPFNINNLTIQDSAVNLNFIPVIYQDSIDTIGYTNITNFYAQDGCSLSGINTIHEKVVPNDYTIFPNPSKKSITIKSEKNNLLITKIEVLDLNGQLLFSLSVSNLIEKEVDVSSLIEGKYLVKIYSGAKQEVLSFIKE